MLDAEQKARVCAAARSYAGVPWRGQGRDMRGVDCTGLIVLTFRDAGFGVEEGDVDYRGIDSKRLLEMVTKYCDRLPAGAPPDVGDIAVYGAPDEAHLGILLSGKPLNIIHCPFQGRVVESRFDPQRGKIRGFYRWR